MLEGGVLGVLWMKRRVREVGSGAWGFGSGRVLEGLELLEGLWGLVRTGRFVVSEHG